MPLPKGLINYPNSIPKTAIRDLVKPCERPVILEIGANDGTDSREMFATIPGLTLHCFEPDPRPTFRFFQETNAMLGQPIQENAIYSRWSKRAGGDVISTITLYPIAIGSEDGQTTFHQSSGRIPGAHVADWDLSGSIHKPTGHLIRSPEIKFDHEIIVNVKTLDSWAKTHCRDGTVDFIFADTQGAEADMILGGRDTLARTRFLYTEFYDTPQYQDQPSLTKIMELLGDNWRPMALFEGYNILLCNVSLQQ